MSHFWSGAEEEGVDHELVKKRARVIMLNRLWRGFQGILLIAIFTLLFMAFQESQAARDALLDCTLPEGECAQQGQRSTAEAIQNITELNLRNMIIVIQCAENTESDQAMIQCVQERIKEQEATQ